MKRVGFLKNSSSSTTTTKKRNKKKSEKTVHQNESHGVHEKQYLSLWKMMKDVCKHVIEYPCIFVTSNSAYIGNFCNKRFGKEAAAVSTGLFLDKKITNN